MRNAIRPLLACVYLMGFAVGAMAKPSIEGFDLVSSAREGRTTFDYTYSVRILGDAASYSGAVVNVTSSSASTIVTKSQVKVGNLDAGTFLRTADTFTIAQDRTVPFDPSSLTFTFVGTAAVQSRIARRNSNCPHARSQRQIAPV